MSEHFVCESKIGVLEHDQLDSLPPSGPAKKRKKIEHLSEAGNNHPYATIESFTANPPIPTINLIIDNKTLKVLEDRQGMP